MAKKKESVLKSWDEVDKSLKKLGELEIQKTKLDGELTIKINELKEEYSTKGVAIKKEAEDIKKEISRFCEQNKDSFVNKRNKKLNFGTLSYKITKKVLCPCVATVIKAIKALNLDFCLRIKEEIEKDKLKELDANTLTKIGVSIIKEDKLSIEPNMAEIAALIS